MVSESLRVKHLGEQGLLQRIQTFCPAGVIGDDAALLAVSPGRSLVVTEDLLVDGVHFSVGLASPGVVTTSPADAGWRAVAANLSDLAAMGATPLGITVGLGLPGDLPVDWIEQLYQGMADCLSRFDTPIVGGDLCRSPVFTVAIAAFGEVQPSRVLRRATAQPGDVILVTGPHGASRAGLELLLYPDQGNGLTEGDRAALIRAHQRPMPRLDVISHLWAVLEAGEWKQEGAGESTPPPFTAMDSSDGLADAVLQICRASGVGAVLHRRQIPLPAGLVDWVGEPQAIAWALYGGEDFELVMCLPGAIARALQAHLPGSAIVGEIIGEMIIGKMIIGETLGEPAGPAIGEPGSEPVSEPASEPVSKPVSKTTGGSQRSASAGSRVILHDETGETPDEILSLDRGFQHFRD